MEFRRLLVTTKLKLEGSLINKSTEKEVEEFSLQDTFSDGVIDSNNINKIIIKNIVEAISINL